MNEIFYARIISTGLVIEHRCLICYIVVEDNAWGCGYGGCVFDGSNMYEFRDGCGAIIELMKTVGVESWEELKGKCIRAKLDSPFGKVIAIGNLFKDQWFSFEEYFEKTRNGECVK